MLLSTIKILQNEHISKTNKFFIAAGSFLLGFWSEIYNITVLFSLFFVSIFFRRKLNRNYLKLILFPFIMGFLLFYINSDWFSGTTVADHAYNRFDSFKTAFYNFSDFISAYIKYLLINKIYFYIVILIPLILLLKEKNNQTNVIINVCLFFLFGYLASNLLFVFFQSVANEYGFTYLFQEDKYEYMYCNILEVIAIVFWGCLYFNYKKSHKYVLAFIFMITLFLATGLSRYYNKIQEKKLNLKLFYYQIEKANVIYNYLGESAILPASFLNSN